MRSIKPFCFSTASLCLLMFLLMNCAVRQTFQQAIPQLYESAKNTHEFPFQIIHAENLVINDTLIDVEKLDLVNENDKITLNNGHLILAHYLGEFFEFEGDTTIFMSDLIYNQYGVFNSFINARPKVSRLFKEKPFYNYLVTGAVMRESYYGIEFLISSPYENHYYLQKGRDICLFWKSYIEEDQDSSITYQVELKNIFDETMDRIYVEGNKVQLSDFAAYDNPSRLVLLRVESFENSLNTLSSIDIAFDLIDEPAYYYPTYCDVSTSAIMSLEMAFYLENSTDFSLAERYYRTAVEISSKNIYKNLLDIYLKRIINAD